jgi:pimeloyl-ACP methyl ester carboxylesterase
VSAGPLLPPGLRGRIVRRRVPVATAVEPSPTGAASAEAARSTGGSVPRLAVAEIGPVDAPAWLIAPGAGSSAHLVAGAFADPVLAAGGRLVTYDLRGHGASSPARRRAAHHLDVVAGDLAAVAASIDGRLEVIGGISLGGHAALRALSAGLIATSPAAVLACLPAFAGPTTRGQGVHAAIAATAGSHGIEELLAGARRTAAMHRWLRSAVLRDQARHDPRSLVAALQALDGADAPTDHERRGLRVPLGVVGWPNDPGHPLAVAERWVATTRRSALVTIAMDDLDAGLDVLGHAGLEAVAQAAGSLTSG